MTDLEEIVFVDGKVISVDTTVLVMDEIEAMGPVKYYSGGWYKFAAHMKSGIEITLTASGDQQKVIDIKEATVTLLSNYLKDKI